MFWCVPYCKNAAQLCPCLVRSLSTTHERKKLPLDFTDCGYWCTCCIHTNLFADETLFNQNWINSMFQPLPNNWNMYAENVNAMFNNTRVTETLLFGFSLFWFDFKLINTTKHNTKLCSVCFIVITKMNTVYLSTCVKWNIFLCVKWHVNDSNEHHLAHWTHFIHTYMKCQMHPYIQTPTHAHTHTVMKSTLRITHWNAIIPLRTQFCGALLFINGNEKSVVVSQIKYNQF